MKSAQLILFHCMLAAAAMAIGISSSAAADTPQKIPAIAPLTPEGEKLQARYAELLKGLQAEVSKTLPVVDEQKKAAFEKAREAAKKTEADASAAQQALSSVQQAKALVDHARGKWIGGAEKNIANAEALLKKATTEAEREAAKEEMAKWQANKADGIKALNERQALLDKAKLDEPKLLRAHQAAQAAMAQEKTDELLAVKGLLGDLEPLLASDKLDAKLVQGAVLANATLRGLAEFAQQGKEQESLVEKLLGDNALMKQMLIAGGARAGKYGRAMEIYTAIQKASPQASAGLFQRLALGICLEHAEPVKQSNPQASTNAPAIVDPVKRYLHYEQAYLNGELDPAFKDFSAWEYRMVVDCDAPDEMLAWGREMLRNYRPDHIYNPDYGWRYSGTVRTEVPYGSQNVK